VPNGNPVDTEKYDYKKGWYKSFNKKIKKTLLENENIIIGGDFNVIPEKIDVYNYKKYENDALFRLEIRKKFYELIDLGFCDTYRYFNKDKQEYTFWDYMAGSWQKNNGLRIDHFLISNNILSSIKNIKIDKKPRSKIKPSDHTPIEIEIT
jgi:exodeoxyribonuclease-3